MMADWQALWNHALQNASCVGLIGLGAFGEQLKKLALEQGLEVELCDPPRSLDEAEDIGEEFFQLWGNGMGGCEMTVTDVESFVPMGVLARRCQVIAIQVPLTDEGTCPTRGMIDRTFLDECGTEARILCFSNPQVVADDCRQDSRIQYSCEA